MNEQHFAIECDRHDESETHEGCTVIVSVATADITDDEGNIVHPAGSLLWASHAPDTIDPATRIGPDYPTLDDRRDTPGDTIQHREAEPGEMTVNTALTDPVD